MLAQQFWEPGRSQALSSSPVGYNNNIIIGIQFILNSIPRFIVIIIIYSHVNLLCFN